MNIHSNAGTCPKSRVLLVERIAGQWSVSEAAAAAGISERTAYKWLQRFRAEGLSGLRDRSSRPHRSPRETPPERVVAIRCLRQHTFSGPEIAHQLGMPPSTVAAVLKRLGLNRLRPLGPREEVVRYERARPGELLHIDIKQLRRFEHKGHRATGDRSDRRRRNKELGKEAVFVCVDDYSRLAYVEVLECQLTIMALGFLRRALDFYRSHGIHVEAVMTDNGACFLKRFTKGCNELDIRHLRTKPRRPQTNGKAERFIQTMLNEWVRRVDYRSSEHRRTHLWTWLLHYNQRRPHASLGRKPPISRVREFLGTH